MTPDRYRRVVELFEAALAVDMGQRSSFLERACGADHDLRSEVEAMLLGDGDDNGGAGLLSDSVDVVAGALIALNPPTFSGSMVGPYRLTSPLGAGGMGIVFEAEDIRLKRKVAIKFLSEELVDDASALGRFQREAQSVAALNHPNICTIHDIGEHSGRPFLVMELMQGESLKQRLDSGPIPANETIEIAFQIASALEAAHVQGILHRDLKPANIFLTVKGQAKILDFGLAKFLPANREIARGSRSSAELEELTRAGVLMGTVAYMSPEQARGEDLDARSDLFAVGAILYEMTSGHCAFGGDTLAVVFDSILNRAPAPPISGHSQTPARLNDIILKLLEKDRTLRFQTAADLAVDLKRLRRDSGSSPTIVQVNVPSAPVASYSTAPPRRVSRRWITFSVATMGLAAIAAAWFLFRPEREKAAGTASPSLVVTTSAPPAEPRDVGTPPKTVSDSTAASKARAKSPAPANPSPKPSGPHVVTANGIEFVRIPAGEFLMGSSYGPKHEQPVHVVKITRAFEIGKYEITQSQWEAVLGYNRSKFKEPTRPVEMINVEDAQAFILALNFRKDGFVYRLPTEAEWEYACRAGTTTEYAGNLEEMGWYDTNSGTETHPVGLKKPNSWGLYDMHGNVYELVQDLYAEDYYAHSPNANPPGPESGEERIYRGGNYFNVATNARCAARNHLKNFRNERQGLRLVRTPL